MVGYRNGNLDALFEDLDFIRHSDGGVSEQRRALRLATFGLYQAFRWWGIGTKRPNGRLVRETLSGIPMVGYRNTLDREDIEADRLYQAFRWWGIGTG